VSGSLLQHSALLKNHWGSLTGYDAMMAYRVLLKSVVSSGEASVLGFRPGVVVFAGLLLAGVIGFRKVMGRPHPWPLLAASVLTLLGYILLYGRNSAAMLPWYIAHLVPPAAYVVGALAGALGRRGVLALSPLLALATVLSLLATLRPWAPHQVAMMEGGRHLRGHPELAPVGAWNGGILAYFAERPVVNLDGLVNDDVYPHVVEGRLLEYVRERKLRYIVDFEAMWTNPRYSERGGYADGRLRAVLVDLGPLTEDRPDLRWEDTLLRLYRVSGLPDPP
jgi:hypothetical protein